MKAKEYNLMSLTVEEGISYGYTRAFKYEENPSEEHIKQTIHDAVMNAICENFYFDDEEK